MCWTVKGGIQKQCACNKQSSKIANRMVGQKGEICGGVDSLQTRHGRASFSKLGWKTQVALIFYEEPSS